MDSKLYDIFSKTPNYSVGNEPKFPEITIKAGGPLNIKKDENTKYIHY